MQKTGKVHPDDLPPQLPEWLDEVWRLYSLMRTQVRMSGTLDYNPVISVVQSVGAFPRLWKILELLQVIESNVQKPKEEQARGK